MIIPQSLLQTGLNFDKPELLERMNISDKQAITMISQRICFYSENVLRIINAEGVEVLYDLTPNHERHSSLKPFRMCQKKENNLIDEDRVLIMSKRDNYTLRPPDQDNPQTHSHFIIDPPELNENDTLARLVIRCQEYKINLEIMKYELQTFGFDPD